MTDQEVENTGPVELAGRMQVVDAGQGVQVIDLTKVEPAAHPYGPRLNPQEVEKLASAARANLATRPLDTLALVDTIAHLNRRLMAQYRRQREARRQVEAARQQIQEQASGFLAAVNTLVARVDLAERRAADEAQARNHVAGELVRVNRQLAAREPMADLGHLSTAIARAESAEREVVQLRRELREQGPAGIVQALDREQHRAKSAEQHVAELQAQVIRLQQTISRQPGDQSDLLRIANDRQETIDDLEKDLRGRDETIRRLQQRIDLQQVDKAMLERGKRLEEQVAKIRERFGIDASMDLYQGLCARVGELQTSEAELVSRPLKAQLHQADQSIKARDSIVERTTSDLRKANQKISTLESEVSLLRQHGDAWAAVGGKIAEIVTDPKVLMGLQTNSSDLRAAIENIRTALRSRGRPGTDALSTAERLTASRDEVRKLEAQLRGLQIALDDWTQAGQKIAMLVGSQEIEGAMQYEGYPPAMEHSWTKLVKAIHEIRAAIPRMVEPTEGKPGA